MGAIRAAMAAKADVELQTADAKVARYVDAGGVDGGRTRART